MLNPTQLPEYQTFLRRVAQDFAPDSELANDLVQETMLYALSRAPQIVHSPKAWLRRVLRSIALNRRTSDRRRRIRETFAVEGEEYDSLEDLHELKRVVRGAVSRLPPEYRSTVELYYFRGLSVDEISRERGDTVDAVKSRLKRARKQLQDDLERRDAREYLRMLLVPYLNGSTASPSLQSSSSSLLLPLTIMAVAASVAGFLLFGLVPDRDEPRDVALTGSTTSGLDHIRRLPKPEADTHARQRALTETALATTDSGNEPTLLARRFQVVDTQLRPLQGVRVRGVSRVPTTMLEAFDEDDGPTAISGANGSGRIDGGPTVMAVLIDDPAWTTVMYGELTGSTSSSSDRGVIVIAARPMSIEGLVVDESGIPLADVRAVLMPGHELGKGNGDLLHASRWFKRRAKTDPNGAFRLEGVASNEGMVLHVTAPGRPPVIVEQLDQHMLVQFAPGSTPILAGRVLDEFGLPVSRAEVSFVERRASDDEGQFALFEHSIGGWERSFARSVFGSRRKIWAAAPGQLPASVEVDLGSPIEDLELRLGGDANVVEGKVVDVSGRPSPHAEVWIEDPTFFGVPQTVMRSVEQCMRRAYAWRPTISDADGDYRLTGLRDREYTLMARDPETAATGKIRVNPRTAVPVAIRLGRATPARRLVGFVRDLEGHAMEGAVIETVLHRQRLITDEGAVILRRRESTRSLSTGVDGRFEIEIQGESHIEVGGTAIPTEFEVDSLSGADPLILVVPRRVYFELSERAVAALAYIEAFDENGVRLRAMRKSIEGLSKLPRYLIQANGKRFSLPETTRSLALHYVDGRTESRAVHPLPESVTILEVGR